MVIAVPNGTAGLARKHNLRTFEARLNAMIAGGSAVAVGLGMSGYGIWMHRAAGIRKDPVSVKRLHRPALQRSAVDALSGAAGEIAALVALYPLDTLKTLCQARSAGAADVFRDVAARGPVGALRTLYAGMGPAAVGAVAMGSLYLMTFYGLKRAGSKYLLHRREQQQSLDSNAESHHAAFDALLSPFAGAAASIVGSLIEAPVEARKIQAQVGNVAGGTRHYGISLLYASFVPFLLKAVPNDVSELFTYSQLHDALTNGSVRCMGIDIAASVPVGFQDMVVGAAAGAAATIASMPFDATFTKMNLGAACLVSQAGGRPIGIAERVASFYDTARTITAQGGGMRALFVGVLPRLMQTIPAGMIYWMAVEATRRTLERNFDVRDGWMLDDSNRPTTVAEQREPPQLIPA